MSLTRTEPKIFLIPESDYIWKNSGETWTSFFLSVYTSLFGRPRSSDQCLDLLPWQYLYQNQDQIYCTYPHNLQKDSLLFKMRREEEKEEDMWLTHCMWKRVRVVRTWALKKNGVHCKTVKAEILNHDEKYFEKLLTLHHIFKNDFKMNNCNCL